MIKFFSKYSLFFLLFIIIFSNGTTGLSADEKTIYLNKSFYYKLYKMHSIARDDYLKKQINLRMQGRGKVVKINEYDRYRKRYMIVLEDNTAATYGFTILLYIFLNNEDTFKAMKKGDTFEYKAQFMAYTPLNSSRSSYIFDLILEDGAVIIE